MPSRMVTIADAKTVLFQPTLSPSCGKLLALAPTSNPLILQSVLYPLPCLAPTCHAAKRSFRSSHLSDLLRAKRQTHAKTPRRQGLPRGFVMIRRTICVLRVVLCLAN